jgi:hypothetical protein
MRFTPTAFLGSLVGGSLVATAIGATSGSFTSGGINYGFLQFGGDGILNISVGANVDILLVGGGAGGFTGSLDAGNGGGGGGVNIVSARLLRGSYTISVGSGGTANENGKNTSLTGYNINYTAGFGNVNGTSGAPQSNNPGSNINCGGDTVGGGGGSAAATGSSAFCPPSGAPNGANGAEGLTLNYNGTPSVYGSGGGGGSATQPFSQGGLGGTNAGNAGNYNDSISPSNAINGFGGGGAGDREGNPNVGSRGGSGTLIIRYQLP